MKEIHEYQHDIASIRTAMERSVKFLSLSGLSGVLAGIYALAGASLTYYILYYPSTPIPNQSEVIIQLVAIACIVLVLSILTAVILSYRKAKRSGTGIWNKTSRALLFLLGIPLVTGGIFILILIAHDTFGLIAPACLIFYGIALVNAGSITVAEIRYLGFSEIALGLAAALLPAYGLIFWAVGFGALHMVYGAVMHYRYDS